MICVKSTDSPTLFTLCNLAPPVAFCRVHAGGNDNHSNQLVRKSPNKAAPIIQFDDKSPGQIYYMYSAGKNTSFCAVPGCNECHSNTKIGLKKYITRFWFTCNNASSIKNDKYHHLCFEIQIRAYKRIIGSITPAQYCLAKLERFYLFISHRKVV